MNTLLRKASMLSIKALFGDGDTPCDVGQMAPGSLPTCSSTSTPLNDAPPTNKTSIPNSEFNDTTIRRKVLAFRTITTMLAHIQQDRFKLEDIASMAPESADELRELKICNALSNLAITNHEVVAVVGKRSSDTLEVFASAHLSNENPLITPLQSPLSQLWHYFITKNFRKDDPVPMTEGPIIINPTMPQGFPVGNEEIIDYLANNRISPNLAEHLWILSSLFTIIHHTFPGARTNHSICLTEYVIVACLPKILHRLEHRTLSQPYINALNKVSVSSPEEIKDLVENLKSESASEKEVRNDEQFMKKFVLRTVNTRTFGVPVPNLIEQSKLADENKDIHLYSSKTCIEFHLLLVELISKFHASLLRLQKSKAEGSISTFREDLTIVRVYGYGLQKLAKGSAFRMHLQAISPLLTVHHDTSGRDRRTEEEDHELEEIQPFIATKEGIVPLWQSYRDWLGLILVHFDAVDILVSYFSEPNIRYATISIKIFVAPPVDKSLLRWTELFTDSTLFPKASMEDPSFSQTNNRLLKFLQETMALNVSDSLRWANEASKAWKEDGNCPHLQQMITNIYNNSKLPTWRESAGKLHNYLANLSSNKSASAGREISNLIQTLADNASFFNSLTKTMFTGTLHCEACLVSLLSYRAGDIKSNSVYDNISVQLKDYGYIIGVSKRCCPTCQTLLSLLAGHSGKPFIVRGFHNTITACTLPPWIPMHIVDAMNDKFGAMLRQELTGLMGRSELLRNRTRSSGSQRLSSDSSSGQVEDNTDIISAEVLIITERRMEELQLAK